MSSDSHADIWRQEMAASRRSGHARRPMPFLPQRPLSHPGEAEARRQLAALPYDDYLQTRHWRRRRDRALWLAGDRCERCGGRRLLDVHHRSYARLGCEDDTDLIVLCHPCHDHTHEELALAAGGEGQGYDEVRTGLADIVITITAMHRVDDDDAWRHYLEEGDL